jgi:hypothetical protein
MGQLPGALRAGTSWCARPRMRAPWSFEMPEYISEMCRHADLDRDAGPELSRSRTGGTSCYRSDRQYTRAGTLPLGAWLSRHLPYRNESRELLSFCPGGIFAAGRQAIQSTPRRVYAALRAELSRGSNLESGHFMERSWMAFFRGRASEQAGDGEAPAGGPQTPGAALSSGAVDAFARLAVYTTAVGDASGDLVLTSAAALAAAVWSHVAPTSKWEGGVGADGRSLEPPPLPLLRALAPCALLRNGSRFMRVRLLRRVRHPLIDEPLVVRAGQLQCLLLAFDERVLRAGEALGWTPVHLASQGATRALLRRSALRAQLAPHTVAELAPFDYTAFVPLAATAPGAVLNLPAVFESISRFLSDGPSVAIALPQEGAAPGAAPPGAPMKAGSQQAVMPIVLRRRTAEATRVGDSWLRHEEQHHQAAEAVAEDVIAAASVTRLLRRESRRHGAGESAAALTAPSKAVTTYTMPELYTAAPIVWWRWWTCRLRGPVSMRYREVATAKMTDGGHGRCCRPGSAPFAKHQRERPAALLGFAPSGAMRG